MLAEAARPVRCDQRCPNARPWARPAASPRSRLRADRSGRRMKRSRMNLPRGPDTLCFDKDEFTKEDFDVDHFVSDCRKHVQLEELRDDLELYYKLLKTAMVELINKDYADFVNLSTNLVGMDKALNQLSVPLGQLREEVLSLRSSVSEGIHAVDERMSKQVDIREKKMCVLRLIQVIRSVDKIEKILNSQRSKETSALEVSRPLLTGQILERIATEFNQLQFHAIQSKGMPLLDTVRPRIAGITAMLQQSLEGLLLEGLQTSNVDIIRHCLRTYATIDKTRDAEALLGQVLVKPYVDEVIVEHVVMSQPGGLQIMYNKLLAFVPHHCRLLRGVTGGSISSEKDSTVPGYDFLVNSVWPEIVQGLEDKLPSLFNPGDPDAFHELLLRPISNENAKDIKKPLVTGSKDPSVTQGNSEDQGSSPSETKPVVSISSTQLVYVAADLIKLQEQLPELLETIKPKLETIGFKNFSSISAALEDSRAALSACAPALSGRIIRDLSESCFSFLKSALEVPRLYRRTNKEVPTAASAYVDSALKPLYQLRSAHQDKLKQAVIQQWLRGALSESTHKYHETVSDVLSAVRRMEESLKRLKHARRPAPAAPAGPRAGSMSDDDKIRLQLALDVQYLGEQIQKMGLQTEDVPSFAALSELVAAAQEQAGAEQP
ncbi:conserved oligomeric Golgi complex subunit 2 isoform X4 [Manis pentadactyla]|uniref:conserved oligomeric Golgi complex subunit 2 isoform X4 n=1 Tax=Manis pentadactyla TaxID=143292 RepID=UPI00255C3ED9|nr:conserved oligomeric Golgi complex subunit 2 isoform X4 [Manis pentadactyla]